MIPPYRMAQEMLEEMHTQIHGGHPSTNVPLVIAEAQVYAILALAIAVEDVGHVIQDVLRTTNAELGSISIALGEK